MMITLKLDKKGGINKGDINMIESDNKSDVYIIQLYKEGTVYNLTGKTIELNILEKRRKYGDTFTLPVYEATQGKIKLEVVEGMTKTDGLFYFQITVKDGKGLVDNFPIFPVEIKNSIKDDIIGAVVAGPYMQILLDAVTKAENAVNLVEGIEDDYKTVKKEIQTDYAKVKEGIQKDYDSLQQIMIDENQAANLQAQINKSNEQLDTKASKSDTNNIQRQVDDLVLGAVGDGNNAEVVQARGSFNTLNARLTNNEYRNYNRVKNLCENISVTKYEGNAEVVSTEGNILTFKINGSNTSSFKLGINVKKGRRYIVYIKSITNSIFTSLSHRVLLGTWKLHEAAVLDNIFSFECTEKMDNGEYVFACNTTEIGVEHKVQFFIYEDTYYNNYLLESCIIDIKNPKLWNDNIESLYTPSNVDRIVPIIKDIHKRTTNTSYLYTIKNMATLKKDNKYFVIVNFVNGITSNNTSIGSIKHGVWSSDIKNKGMDIRLRGDKTFFTSIIQPTVDTKTLSFSFGQIAAGSTLGDIHIFIFKIDETSEEILLKLQSGFDDISFIRNNKLSTLQNDLSINNFNQMVPIYTSTRNVTLQNVSGYFMAIDAIKLYANKKYYISIEVPDGAYSRYLRLRTLKSGMWTDVLNVDLSLRQYNEQHYYEGFFSPNEDIYQVLYFEYNGATVNESVSHILRIYEVKDNTTEALLKRLGGYAKEIIDINKLSKYDPTLVNDTFDYIDKKVTTRTETSNSTYFQATNKIKMSKDKLYYLAIDWKSQPLFRNSLYVRTLVSGAWDNKVNAVVYPRYTNRGTYYECYFSPTEDIENSLYLNFSGANIGAEYEYDVYIYEIEHEMQEYALRVEYGFLNPSFRLANTCDRHFRGKVCSALGDSLTAIGSGGHYLQFIKNQLGFSKVKQCGVGGSTVSGTGQQCMWQTGRINDLLLDSDFILFKGSTNDSGFIEVKDSEFTIDNCDVTSFVGAYNVALSKIYYKYLKLNKGYYADKGIDYSGVTQVDNPKNIKIYLITTPKTIDRNAPKRAIFAEYVRRIGKMWGLPIIDADAEMQMNPFNYPLDFEDKVHYPLEFHYNLAKLAVGKMRQTESF